MCGLSGDWDSVCRASGTPKQAGTLKPLCGIGVLVVSCSFSSQQNYGLFLFVLMGKAICVCFSLPEDKAVFCLPNFENKKTAWFTLGFHISVCKVYVVKGLVSFLWNSVLYDHQKIKVNFISRFYCCKSDFGVLRSNRLVGVIYYTLTLRFLLTVITKWG